MEDFTAGIETGLHPPSAYGPKTFALKCINVGTLHTVKILLSSLKPLSLSFWKTTSLRTKVSLSWICAYCH